MSQTNHKAHTKNFTYEGAPSTPNSPIKELRRSTMAALLWEDNFYEDGITHADRVKQLIHRCGPTDVAMLAVELRNTHNLRHIPLLLLRELTRHAQKHTMMPRLNHYFPLIIKRPDELTEFMALYWANGKVPIAKQAKLGLKAAFTRFSAYALAKYNRKKEVKLRDVMFMTHPKPSDLDPLTTYAVQSEPQKYNKPGTEIPRHRFGQSLTWRKLADDSLEAPDTWEVALSAGSNKRETFARLLKEGKLGYMALLRNLRNMIESGVPRSLIEGTLLNHEGKNKILPFRFLTAIRHAPSLATPLDHAMLCSLQAMTPMKGNTILLVDVSGSMLHFHTSAKSELTRLDAASALAILVRGICSETRVLTFAIDVVEVPAFHGLALANAITNVPTGGTFLGKAIQTANRVGYDRIIVFTDEQSHDQIGPPLPGSKAYMINIATYKNGVSHGPWTRINGFSEGVVRYIQAIESDV